MNNPILPLSIPDHICMIDGLEMIEPIDPLRVKALIKSGFLKTTRPRFAGKDIENDKDQMQKYLKNYNKELGGFKVKYTKSYKHKWGRCFPVRSAGLTAMRRENRATLINESMADLDIENCHPKALHCILNANSEHIPILSKYCEHRKEILEEICLTYSTSEKAAKQLIPTIINGLEKGWLSWLMEYKVENHAKNLFVKDFIIEMERVAKKLKEHNPALYEIARTSKEGKENKNVLGTFMSLYTSEWEVRIVEHCIMRLDMVNAFGRKDIREGTYEYDGIKLCFKNIIDNDKLQSVEIVIQLLEYWCKELGFDLNWKEKKHSEDMYDIQEAYNEIVELEKENTNLWLVSEKIRKFMCGHAGVIEIIELEKKDNYIWKETENKWYCWDSTDNKWCSNVYPLSRYVITEVYPFLLSQLEPFKLELENDEIPENLRTPNQVLYYKLLDEINIFNKQVLRKNWEVNAIISMAKCFLINDLIVFDENPDLFGCNNGVLDIKEEIFRPYRFNDYCTMSCKWDFKKVSIEDTECTPEEIAEKNEIFKLFTDIFPNDSVKELMLVFYATGLSGKCLQRFFILNGSGGNGKGVLNGFMKHLFGDYFYTIKCSCLTENLKNSGSGSANSEIAGLSKKRLVIAEEPAEGDTLNNSVIKNWTGGGEIKARELYKSDARVVNMMTLALETNTKANFKEKPTGGDERRLGDIEYVARFTNDEPENIELHIHPKNEKYSQIWWRDKHKNVMLNALFNKVIELKNTEWDFDSYVPDCVKERSLAYLQDSEPLHQCFTSIFEKRREEQSKLYKDNKAVTNDEDWSIPKIASEIMKSPAFHTNEIVPAKMRSKMSAASIKEFFMKAKFYSYCRYKNGDKWLLRDWRLKVLIEDNDDN